MKNYIKNSLALFQIRSMMINLPKALKYHYKNFKDKEDLLCPSDDFNWRDQFDGVSLDNPKFISFMEKEETIRFDIQSYLLQLGRFYHFLKSNQIQTLINIDSVNDEEVKEIWNDIMVKKGIISLLIMKWVKHRSYDWPLKDDTDKIHHEVVSQLELSYICGEGKYLIQINGKLFSLTKKHRKIMKLIAWVFKEINKKTPIGFYSAKRFSV